MNVSFLILPAALLLMMYKTDAKIELISNKQDFRVGEEILLFCKAGREGEMVWKKDDEEITDDTKVIKIDEASSKLIIMKAAMEDAGTYTCWCDFDGHTDEKKTDVYVFDGPSFGNTKTFHEFLEGTMGTMPCLVTGQPAVQVRWLRNNNSISRDAGSHFQQSSDNTLYIDKVKREHAGSYLCRAYIKGRPIFVDLPISVVVNVLPTVHLKEEEKKVLASPETNVSLLCLVDGIPKPNINWTIPTTIDPSRHQFNSDRSQLMIRSVTRSDYGEYVCTAWNKIAESSATIMLHVFEAPEVFVSAELQRVSVGERVAVSCNVSGHPQPGLHWINKHNGRLVVTTSGHIHISEGVLVIEEIMPSDGGLYSCMAVGTSGNASRDVAIHTQPGPPYYLSAMSGPAKISFSLKSLPPDGGTPITGFVLQWKQEEDKQWNEISVPVSDPLIIPNLKQYTSYTVRLAASNVVGVGQFSENKLVRTPGIREPETPVLSPSDMKVERNTFYIPLRQADHGASPVQHFDLRYRKDKDGAQWIEIQLSPTADSISLQDLSFGSDYEVEVTAVNVNGSSIPGTFNFTIGEQPVSSMTKGSVVGIVIVIFLVVFLIVDATCCYKNHCGLLMSIAVKLFGQKVPGMKMFDQGSSNGEGNLNGMSTPRGSLQMGGVKKEAGELTEVTCDKVSLTKHEKAQPGREKQAVSA